MTPEERQKAEKDSAMKPGFDYTYDPDAPSEETDSAEIDA